MEVKKYWKRYKQFYCQEVNIFPFKNKKVKFGNYLFWVNLINMLGRWAAVANERKKMQRRFYGG